MVVDVLITSCHVSEYWNIGPVAPHPTMTARPRTKARRAHERGGGEGELAEERVHVALLSRRRCTRAGGVLDHSAV